MRPPTSHDWHAEEAISDRIRSLEANWSVSVDRFLPRAGVESIWRFGEKLPAGMPDQGWKIHVAATILNARDVLETVGPILSGAGVLFKAPATLIELKKINCGLYYGFSQVGKFITVFPTSEGMAIDLVKTLCAATANLHGPTVPYDKRACRNGLIYYRFGSFSGDTVRLHDGTIVPDVREPNRAVPMWISDPFVGVCNIEELRGEQNAFRTSFLAFEALSQRGKGGVYRALDIRKCPSGFSVIKEGRQHGETDWDGRDGRWRVGHEERVLNLLRSRGVAVPKVLIDFDYCGSKFLALEHIEGQNLQELSTLSGRLSLGESLNLAGQIARLLAEIHEGGWIWRDCKPLNFIANSEGVVRPLDFEGACDMNKKDKAPWGTLGYVPPEWPMNSGTAQDLYALGATVHHLLSGRAPQGRTLAPIGTLRRSVPQIVRDLISSLLKPEPLARPSANEAAQVFKRLSG
jgi:class IV lanthipeptide synthase